ncbi:transcriptional regulator, TetR family [Arboricoccus pini]|uniref:Transcriptional regulator, TetR family n=1 Tax=Arboricoccus pini TaxID=1963835 RepID=A0A212Q893_9PROT|nr:TetR/AcrR family transcriptional regulator [Arboricoccus pini]SNB55591.1 transcriptional regulator, TetR family [Arboricoccus pini]
MSEELVSRRAAARSGPGRPRGFDFDTAIERAVETFALHGYHGTSVQHLTEATGLARGSLYKAFADKRDLFMQALEHYTLQSQHRLAQALVQPGPVKEAIRGALAGYGRRCVSWRGRRGCILTTAAMEMVPQDPEIDAVIGRMFRRIQDLFAAAIIRGQANGEISCDLDERAVARFLLTVVQGLRVLGKTGPDEAAIDEVVVLAMRALD